MYKILCGTKYCRDCGHETEKFKTGKFDVQTGQPIWSTGCVNPKCEDGCHNTTGHKNSSWWGMQKCRDCGHVPYHGF